MKKRIGKTLKVGSSLYTIVFQENLFMDNIRVWGAHSYNSQIITLETNMTYHLTAEVLLHEITHAIFNMFSLNDTSTEEQIAEAMGKGWAMVFLDNPWLTKFMQHKQEK